MWHKSWQAMFLIRQTCVDTVHSTADFSSCAPQGWSTRRPHSRRVRRRSFSTLDVLQLSGKTLSAGRQHETSNRSNILRKKYTCQGQQWPSPKSIKTTPYYPHTFGSTFGGTANREGWFAEMMHKHAIGSSMTNRPNMNLRWQNE